MLPSIHLKNEIDVDHVPVTFVKISNDPVCLTNHIPFSCTLKIRIDRMFLS